MAMPDIEARILDRELKKGSAELIILSIVDEHPRHGYEISKLIEARSEGEIKFNIASLYPLLYSLTPEGRRVLVRQRETWKAFVRAMGLVTGVEHA